MKWYVLAVEEKKEPKLRKEILRQSIIRDMEKAIGQIVIPKVKVQKIVKGAYKEVNEVAFPGYLILQLDYSDNVFHLLGSVEGCYGLLLDHTNPTALDDEEAVRVLLKTQEKPIPTEVVLNYQEGSLVEIVDGAFKGMDAEVSYIDMTNSFAPLVGVKLRLWGQWTELVQPHDHLEKV